VRFGFMMLLWLTLGHILVISMFLLVLIPGHIRVIN
jgi:hypothetical protein